MSLKTANAHNSPPSPVRRNEPHPLDTPMGGAHSQSEVCRQAFHEALRSDIAGDRLRSELQRFGLHPERYRLTELLSLKERLAAHSAGNPEFRREVEYSRILEFLGQCINRLERQNREPHGPARSAPAAVPLRGMLDCGIQKVVRELQLSLGIRHQIVIRGGGLNEGVGWLSAGPDGDPRVAGSRSMYTRRTGIDPPSYDLTMAARNGTSREVSQLVEDAACYGRSGSLAEQCHDYVCRNCSPEAQEDQARELMALDDDRLPFERPPSRGVLLVFSDDKGAYDPTFHRHDPRWNHSSYDFAVTMPGGSRHLRAIIPIPDHRQPFPDGAFAVIITPEIAALPHEIKGKLFDAAFRRMDIREFNDVLEYRAREGTQ